MKAILARLYRTLDLPKNLQLLIMRLFQDRFLVGVTGIIFNDKDEILLFNHTYRQTPWGLPGGYLKGGEHPREGLEREIAEESGLTVSADRRLKIRTDRETARLDLVYIGTYIGGRFSPSHEVSEARFFAFSSLPLIPKKQLYLVSQAVKIRHLPETGSQPDSPAT